MDVTLTRLENQLRDLTKLADNFGLLDDVKSKWETSLRREIRNQTNQRDQTNQTNRRNQKNQVKRLLDMTCLSKVDRLDRFIRCHAFASMFHGANFEQSYSRHARLCNDAASSVGPLTLAGTIFLQIVALVVSFFMAVQYFLRYAPRRLLGSHSCAL
eukprot:s982_g12.t1